MKLEKINSSYIYYDENYISYVKQYYLYCISIFIKILEKKNYNYNFIFGNYDYKFPNKNPFFKIGFQIEHTLILQGGRDVSNAHLGKIKSGNSYYLAYVQGYNELKKMDFIIEYSKPNYINILKSGFYDNYIKKNTIISPALYKNLHINNNRSKNVVTTFINTNEPRRKKILNELVEKKVSFSNETNQFNSEEVLNLYTNTKILINVHQTNHHHTLEELRILPALQCGCVIISENVPLKDEVPYSNFILWADYEEIVDKTIDVVNNYETIFKNLILDKNLNSILDEIQDENEEKIKNLLTKIRVNFKVKYIKMFQQSFLYSFWTKIILRILKSRYNIFLRLWRIIQS